MSRDDCQSDMWTKDVSQKAVGDEMFSTVLVTKLAITSASPKFAEASSSSAR